MRAKIRTEKTEEGKYILIAILPDGKKEYPREGFEYTNKSSVMADARYIYNGDEWSWRESDHTIKID